MWELHAAGAVVPYQHGILADTIAVDRAYRGGVYSPTQNRVYFVPFLQGPEEDWHYVDGATGAVVRMPMALLPSIRPTPVASSDG